MDFEELLDGAKKVKAPVFFENTDLDTKEKQSIVNQLKSVDKKTRRGIRLIQVTYVFLILFILSFLLIAENLFVKSGIVLIAFAFLMVIFVQQLRFRKYNYCYTSVSVISFLKDAKKRMRVFTSRTWFVIPIWVFIDLGLCFIISQVFPFPRYTVFTIAVLQVVLLLAIVLDFYSAYVVWKRQQKPVLIEIDKMLEENEN